MQAYKVLKQLRFEGSMYHPGDTLLVPCEETVNGLLRKQMIRRMRLPDATNEILGLTTPEEHCHGVHGNHHHAVTAVVVESEFHTHNDCDCKEEEEEVDLCDSTIVDIPKASRKFSESKIEKAAKATKALRKRKVKNSDINIELANMAEQIGEVIK